MQLSPSKMKTWHVVAHQHFNNILAETVIPTSCEFHLIFCSRVVSMYSTYCNFTTLYIKTYLLHTRRIQKLLSTISFLTLPICNHRVNIQSLCNPLLPSASQMRHIIRTSHGLEVLVSIARTTDFDGHLY